MINQSNKLLLSKFNNKIIKKHSKNIIKPNTLFFKLYKFKHIIKKKSSNIDYNRINKIAKLNILSNKFIFSSAKSNNFYTNLKKYIYIINKSNFFNKYNRSYFYFITLYKIKLLFYKWLTRYNLYNKNLLSLMYFYFNYFLYKKYNYSKKFIYTFKNNFNKRSEYSRLLLIFFIRAKLIYIVKKILKILRTKPNKNSYRITRENWLYWSIQKRKLNYTAYESNAEINRKYKLAWDQQLKKLETLENEKKLENEKNSIFLKIMNVTIKSKFMHLTQNPDCYKNKSNIIFLSFIQYSTFKKIQLFKNASTYNYIYILYKKNLQKYINKVFYFKKFKNYINYKLILKLIHKIKIINKYRKIFCIVKYNNSKLILNHMLSNYLNTNYTYNTTTNNFIYQINKNISFKYFYIKNKRFIQITPQTNKQFKFIKHAYYINTKYSKIFKPMSRALIDNWYTVKKLYTIIFKQQHYHIFFKITKYSAEYNHFINIMLNNFFFKYKKKPHQKYSNISNYFSYKIKLKPGFSTLWRLFRKKCKQIYKLNFKFQHMLTKFVNIISSINAYYKLIYWYTTVNSIFKKQFIKKKSLIFLYINGIQSIFKIKFNKYFFNKTQLNLINLFPGDIVQMPYSYKFILLYKNIKIFNILIFTQQDLSSLSLCYLYYNTLLYNWGYNKRYSHNLFNFKIYNWKYIT